MLNTYGESGGGRLGKYHLHSGKIPASVVDGCTNHEDVVATVNAKTHAGGFRLV